MIHRSNHEFAYQYQAHSCLRILKNKRQIMAPRVTPLEGVSTYAPQGIRVRGVENPQGFGIDERRFVDLKIQRFSKVYAANSLKKLPQSMQRAQSSAMSVTKDKQAAASRFRTQIARIFADIVDQFASMYNSSNHKPQRSQRTQSRIANLCALCVLCGELTLFPAKDANGKVE